MRNAAGGGVPGAGGTAHLVEGSDGRLQGTHFVVFFVIVSLLFRYCFVVVCLFVFVALC
jgi:hypothetical protein